MRAVVSSTDPQSTSTEHRSSSPTLTQADSYSDSDDHSYDTIQEPSPTSIDSQTAPLLPSPPLSPPLVRHSSEPLPDLESSSSDISLDTIEHPSTSHHLLPTPLHISDHEQRSEIYDDDGNDDENIDDDRERDLGLAEDGDQDHSDLVTYEIDDEEDNCRTPIDHSELYPISTPPRSGSPHPDLGRRPSGSAPARICSRSSTPSINMGPMKTLGDMMMSPDSDVIEDSLIYGEELSSPTRLPSILPHELSRPFSPSENLHQHPIDLQTNPRDAHHQPRAFSQLLSFSLWEHLKYEVDSTDDANLTESLRSTNQRSERVSNFLNVPIAIEKMILFGFVICLDAFLSVFTILPIKFFFSLYRLIHHRLRRIPLLWRPQSARPSISRLNISHKVDLMQGLLIILACVVLHQITDASRMYHLVRGQETIKLYVIFNVLEIADRLCCSFGQDILDSLFSSSTLGRRTDGTQPRMKPMFLFILAFVFTVAHTLVLFYQLVSLNVAINSYDHSLITLLISNQFVEIKGSVFKKFEKENLFQMSCADIVERFQLFLMLHVIAFRNLIELWDSSSPTHSPTPSHAYSHTYQYLPTSFNLFPSLSLVQTIFLPPAIVLLSEVSVDWLKHAFITKFNHIRPSVYGRFIDVLCKDLVGDDESVQSRCIDGTDRKNKPFVDKSPAVSRRLGFSVFPICCLTVRVIFQAWDMISEPPNDDYTQFKPQSDGAGLRSGEAEWRVWIFNLQDLLIRSRLVPSSFKAWLSPHLILPPTKTTTSNFINSDFSTFQFNLLLSLSILTGLIVLILFKLYLGIWLRIYAGERMKSLEERLKEDRLNDYGRAPIGSSALELLKEKENQKLLESSEFDVPSMVRGKVVEPLMVKKVAGGVGVGGGAGEVLNKSAGAVTTTTTTSGGGGGGKRAQIPMEELSRFDMVRSRIW